MTTPSGDPPADPTWRQGADPSWQAADPPAGTSGYPGPPPHTPPPADWRPQVVRQPPPPRQLPPQDLLAVDAAEKRALRLTYAVSIAAGAVVIIAICVVCGRLLF